MYRFRRSRFARGCGFVVQAATFGAALGRVPPFTGTVRDCTLILNILFMLFNGYFFVGKTEP